MAEFTYPMANQTATIHAHDALADVYRRDPMYTEVLPEVEESDADHLKGRALVAELKARGLSTHGTVAEKRARLVDAPPAPTPDPTVQPSPAVEVALPEATIPETEPDGDPSDLETIDQGAEPDNEEN